MIPRIYSIVKVAKGAANSLAAPAASNNSNNTGNAKSSTTLSAKTQAAANGAKANKTSGKTPTTRLSVGIGDKTYHTNINGKATLSQMKTMADALNRTYHQTKTNKGRALLQDSGPSYSFVNASKASNLYDTKAYNAAVAKWRIDRAAFRKNNPGQLYTVERPNIKSFKKTDVPAEQSVTMPQNILNSYQNILGNHLLGSKPMTSLPVTNLGVARAVGKDVNALTAQDYKNVGQHYTLKNQAYLEAQRRVALDQLALSIANARGYKSVYDMALRWDAMRGPNSLDKFQFELLQDAGALPSTIKPNLAGTGVISTPLTYASNGDYGKLSDVLNKAVKDMVATNNTYKDYGYNGVTIPLIHNFTNQQAELKGYSGPTLIGTERIGGRSLASDLNPINLPEIPSYTPSANSMFIPGAQNPYLKRINQLLNLSANAPTPIPYAAWNKFFGNLSAADRQIINKNRELRSTWDRNIGAQISDAQDRYKDWMQQAVLWYMQNAGNSLFRLRRNHDY